MKIEIREFRLSDEQAVAKIWEDCGLVVPWNDPHKDIQRKRAMQSELFLVGLDGPRIVATVMSGYDGHRGWIYYCAVEPDLQRKGVGKLMVAEAEKRLRALGCPKINLQVRSSNKDAMEFYRKIGFKQDDVVSFGKRLEQD